MNPKRWNFIIVINPEKKQYEFEIGIWWVVIGLALIAFKII